MGASVVLKQKIVLIPLLFGLHCACAADVVDEAKALLEARQAQAAYELLKPLEEERAGDPNFDYVLGLAALDSGKSLEAVFALERAVDVAPELGPARAELARAYLALGDTDEAKTEFEKVKQMDLPPAARETVDSILSGIDLYHGVTRTRYYPYVQTGFGYDTNVNSATDASTIAVPIAGGFVPFSIAAANKENSPIWKIGTGFRFTSPINIDKGVSLFGGANIDHRVPVDEADFKSSLFDGQLGVHWLKDKHQFRVSAEGNVAKIRGPVAVRSDREVGGVSGQWQYNLNKANQLTAFSQFSLVRYPEQRARDVNRFMAGVGWGHAYLDAPGAPLVFISGFGGFEDEKSHSRGAHFARKLFGVRGGGQYNLGEKGAVLAAVTYQLSDYDNADPVFLKQRDDDFVNLDLGYRYRCDKHWSVTPTFRYTDNASNIPTSDYDRMEFMVVVRNDF